MNAWGLNNQRAMLNSGSVINILDEARKRAPKSAVSSYPHPVDRKFHDNHSPKPGKTKK